VKVLVAGIGNIFLGDDGFGVEVAQRLVAEPRHDGVRVEDYGIRGIHLAYELLDGYDALVLIDAVSIGEPPGTLALIEPDMQRLAGAGGDDSPAMDAHSMNPAVVLGMLAGMGGSVGRTFIVGCQPAVLDENMGLSTPVAAAIDDAVGMVHDVLAELLGPEELVPEEEESRA